MTTNHERLAMLPCPFCGGEAVSESHDDNGWYVGCIDYDNCGFTPSAWYGSEVYAAERWNKRAT